MVRPEYTRPRPGRYRRIYQPYGRTVWTRPIMRPRMMHEYAPVPRVQYHPVDPRAPVPRAPVHITPVTAPRAPVPVQVQSPPRPVPPSPPPEVILPVVGGREHIGSRVSARAAQAFYGCRPPVFEGRPRTMSTRAWLHRIEFILQNCDVDRDCWVPLAVSMFDGDALIFWDHCDKEILLGFSWEEFSQNMSNQFPGRIFTQEPDQQEQAVAAHTSTPALPTPAVSFMTVRAFIHQVDGFIMWPGETVLSYAARFKDAIVSQCPLPEFTEADQCSIFWGGLLSEYKNRVLPQRTQTIREFIDVVIKEELKIQIEHSLQIRRERTLREDILTQLFGPHPMAHDHEAGPSRQPGAADADDDNASDGSSDPDGNPDDEEDPEEFPLDGNE